MAEESFLLVRLGSLGDVVHALPAAGALRDTFHGARIDWVIDPKWLRLLDGNPDLTSAIPFDRKSPGGSLAAIRRLREARYTCAVDFQALYKSAFLSFASGARRRIGFSSAYAREGLAARFYTERYNPRGPHKVDHNLTLAAAAGAKIGTARFPLAVHAQDDEIILRELGERNLSRFFVLNPGGGWRSKCWPAERYGELHRALTARYGFRGVVSVGPGEEDLARAAVAAAGDCAPSRLMLPLGPLLALLRRAEFVVSADTGPLHLASALGTPSIGVFGPTDPARNGPYAKDDVYLRNPRFSETTYNRGASYSHSMLSITVEQVVAGVARRRGEAA
ncbi:MAG TPA: glycosyltransferase family 9 protein [Verrucomicrobiae bacterium]|nr:glycosyltransferase family 9 protein [Verrucomicrobiae bacterium]